MKLVGRIILEKHSKIPIYSANIDSTFHCSDRISEKKKSRNLMQKTNNNKNVLTSDNTKNKKMKTQHRWQITRTGLESKRIHKCPTGLCTVDTTTKIIISSIGDHWIAFHKTPTRRKLEPCVLFRVCLIK